MSALPSLARWAWLSIAAAVVTIAMKAAAYAITGSVGLLSDALESVVNLVAAILALVALTVAARPADDTHHFGHGKAEYFSAGAEGAMIFVAAALIIYAAIDRLLHPQALESLGIGLAVTLAATAINGIVGILLMRIGKRHRSITLVADGRHLMTDVYTSVGVVVGVALVGLTGWLPLDSLVAIAVGVNILWTGANLMRHSMRGLMDHALPADDEERIVGVLRDFAATQPPGTLEFHGLQTREAGRQRFVSLHVLVPGSWSVTQSHDLVEDVEAAIRQELPDAHVQTHLEPREDPRSHGDYAGGPRIVSAEAIGHGALGEVTNAPVKPTAKWIIERLGLQRLPVESTFFANTYRSDRMLDAGQHLSTAMVGLLAVDPLSVSLFHRLAQDEIWHFYAGDPLRLLLLRVGGCSEIILGPDLAAGQRQQVVVPAGCWQAAEVAPGGDWSLFGCSAAPGFRGEDFASGFSAPLLLEFPDYADDIRRLSVPDGDVATMPTGFS